MRKGILYDRYIRDDGRTKDKETLNSWVKEADEQIAKLKASFPKGGPYVLTHCDLHFENIFVSNENEEKKWKVTGIIDWETAGFYPWWAEAMKDKFSDDYFTEIETEKFKQLSGPGGKTKDMPMFLTPILRIQNSTMKNMGRINSTKRTGGF
ncbi:hypothetical protein M7I_7167 [Glarea lozoyensis 74030]|uniref:Aminoglycoside phosphotransferase domain-containing protein n=1 Tax=Glarea lozoyensis (strain ATCC 74030 / MF5533) TaxID=1104152 RepID=H0EWJ9_GLAL7|nr:hypothetical protein M7I_7167 [Glarea lozoyensis 74030]